MLLVLSYLSVVILIVVLSAKVIKYSKMPLHLRWELYPVPHEKGREYGGSYFEELDWWEKPVEKSIIKEIVFMVPEILFVKGVYNDNRKLWYGSFPFHFGLYLVIGWLAFLFIGALVSINGFSPESAIATFIQSMAIICGAVGFVVGSIGCIGLLFLRTFDNSLRSFAAPKDYFNLVFILAVLLTGLIAWSSSDPSFAMSRDYMKSLITFSPVTGVSASLATHIILLSLFMIYMPFTHMSHFVAKYFTWHKVRWDDERNMRGSKIEGKINKLLNTKQNWSAPHIKSGETWATVATQEVE